jgi:hypothetical protein
MAFALLMRNSNDLRQKLYRKTRSNQVNGSSARRRLKATRYSNTHGNLH